MDTANRLFNEQLMVRLKDIASGTLEEKEKQAALEAEAAENAEGEGNADESQDQPTAEEKTEAEE
jgi:hypothetical protein